MKKRWATGLVAGVGVAAALTGCGATTRAAAPTTTTTTSTTLPGLDAGKQATTSTTTPTTATTSTTVPQATTTTTVPAATLPTATQTVGGVTVQVPEGWTEHGPGSTGGDFAEYLWISPDNPGEQLLVVADACAGCVADGTPAGLAPQGSTAVEEASPTEATFELAGTPASASTTFTSQAGTLSSGDHTDGVVKTDPSPSATTAYAVVDVSLPTGDHSTATAILNSVTISGS